MCCLLVHVAPSYAFHQMESVYTFHHKPAVFGRSCFRWRGQLVGGFPLCTLSSVMVECVHFPSSIIHHALSCCSQLPAVTTLRQLLVFFLHFGATPHFSFFTYSRTSYPYIPSTTLYPYMLCTSLKKEPLYPYTLGTSLKQQNTKFQRGHLLT